jgi:ABC-type multidrug transport system fused ATPase/permease subunit
MFTLALVICGCNKQDDFMSSIDADILTAVISLVMVYIELFKVNWKLSLLTFLAAPLILLWMTVYRRINNKYHHRIREMNSIINASMAQYVDGMAIIQQFNKEEEMTNEYDNLLSTNYGNKMRALKINSIFGGELLLLIQNGLLALIIYYFGRQFLTNAGAITAGALYLYVTYSFCIKCPLLLFHTFTRFV